MLYQNAYSFIYKLYSLLCTNGALGTTLFPCIKSVLLWLWVIIVLLTVHKQQRVIPLKDSCHDEWWGNTTLISYK